MPEIDLKNYEYQLPDEKIARFPAEPRDSSKFLVYKEGTINHRIFNELPQLLPEKSLVIFNNTKVIPARVFFQKPSGAVIQLFLLHPIAPFTHVNDAMNATEECTWECAIGNLKRWNDGLVLSLMLPNHLGNLNAELLNREEKKVKLSWSNKGLAFSEMLMSIGEVPLPPYLNRKPVEKDKETYQTVYSSKKGAVAAPTAGLHFTNDLLEEIRKNGIKTHEITLHVSAGTFQPIKTENVFEHPMHTEQIVIATQNIEALLSAKKLITVGTTSIRTLESLYWFGVKLISLQHPEKEIPFSVEKLLPYQVEGEHPTRKTSLEAVQSYMQKIGKDKIVGETSIFILPGYDFKMSDALITNFHQPGSTLILLIAAYTGENWRKIYNAALENDYRFLSYGDSSILFKD